MTRSRSLLSTALLLTLAACTTPAPPANDEPLPPANSAPVPPSSSEPLPSPAPLPPASDGAPPTSGPCNAAAAGAAVGQLATADVVEQVRRDSGARIARILHPGEIITMEFSADRVNVRVDAHNRILAVTCG